MTLMLKALLYLVIGLLVIASVYFVNLSLSSRKQPDLGLLNNQLRVCPATPNCVCSEAQGTGSYVEPLATTTTVNKTVGIKKDDAWITLWEDAKKSVVENGGNIMTERDGYLHATFVTTLLRYVDDVELRLDKNKQLIHIRSASRVGRSDMGANRVRVEKIRKAFLNNTFHDSSEK
jgi:uncharacterized protein (DUF1499 family)